MRGNVSKKAWDRTNANLKGRDRLGGVGLEEMINGF
jgi:hypothetical protein